MLEQRNRGTNWGQSPPFIVLGLSRKHIMDVPVCLHVNALQKWASKSFKWALDRFQQSFRKDKSVHSIRYFSCKVQRESVWADREKDRDGWREGRREEGTSWGEMNTCIYTFTFSSFTCLFSLLQSNMSAYRDSLGTSNSVTVHSTCTKYTVKYSIC